MDMHAALVPATAAGTLRLPDAGEHLDARLTLDAPALELMTDLRRVPPVSVPASTAIDEALRLMTFAGVRFLFVIDATQRLVGSITAYDIQGEKPVLYLQSVDGTLESRTHHEIEVRHIMEPVGEWQVLLLPAVKRLRLRHVAAMFRETGRRHLVVVAPEDGVRAAKVCGLFSATQLERELGLQMGEPPRAERFVEIQQALGHR